MIGILLIFLMFCCCISCLSSLSFIFYEQAQWKCIEKESIPKQYIIGRTNVANLGNAECLYDDQFPGCYVIDVSATQNNRKAKENANKRCENIIKTFPNVRDSGENYTMKHYTCGKNSTNQKLWNATGYEHPNSDCSLIKKNTNLNKTIKNILG